MRKYKILVAGCGSIGQRHARLLSARRDVELYLTDVSRDNTRYCQEHFAVKEAFDDYSRALEYGMDGVFICVPTELHVPFAKQALSAGAYVMIEKPVGLSVAETESLWDFPDAESRIQIGYTGRYASQLIQVKRMVENGELGNLVYANASVYTYGTLLHARTPFRDKESWSLIRDYTHEIDFMFYLLGSAEEVVAMSATLGDLDHLPRPNVVEIVSRYRSGVIGSIHMDYARYPDKRTLELVGDRGSVELYLNDGIVRFYDKDSKGFREEREPFIRDDLFVAQIETVIGMIKKEAKPIVSLRDGIEALRFCEAAIASSDKRKFVRLERKE
jgi:D-apiose dehydrogenase